MADLPILCDQREPGRCCGVAVCLTAGIWTDDPYDEPVMLLDVRTPHRHSEPICAHPDCESFLTRPQMAALNPRFRPAEDAP